MCRTVHVLVVDDNVDSADSLGELLRLPGHQVRLAHDGAGALEAVKLRGPTSCCSTSACPASTATKWPGGFRARPENAGMLLVAVSGYGQDEDRNRSRQAGFDHHLIKPVDFPTLEKVMAAAPLKKRPSGASPDVPGLKKDRMNSPSRAQSPNELHPI